MTASASGALTLAVSVPVNHVLRAAAWARATLSPYRGKVARFECGPLAVALEVLASGEVADADAAAAMDPGTTVITLSPAIALRTLAGDAHAWREVKIAGDAGFASAIAQVAQNLRWDIEEDLSRVLGDIAAHRVAETGRHVVRWGRRAATRLAADAAAYWTEEQPLLTRRAALDLYAREVGRLRADLDNVERRIEQLALRSRNAGAAGDNR